MADDDFCTNGAVNLPSHGLCVMAPSVFFLLTLVVKTSEDISFHQLSVY